MSILKKAREGSSPFRPPVPMQNNEPVENPINGNQQTENAQTGTESIIERMAEDIVEQKLHVRKKKNKLDRLERTLAITVSPRIEAEWRYHANNENRSLASWVRQAVDFYIRKHGL